MNKEDILRMAREAGCLGPGKGGDPNGLWEPNGHENVTALMVRFATLVAAAEREACAKVCDDKWIYTASPSEMAEYIRARSEK